MAPSNGSKYDGLIRARGRAAADVDDAPGRHEDLRADGKSPSAGKRSNAEYRQVSAYVRKDTHRKVKMALLEDDREFSELVEELLDGWLASRA